jgi:hypothetical protein
MTDDFKDVLVATDANDQIVGFGYLNCGSDEPCLANVLLNGRSWQRRHGHPVRQFERHRKPVQSALWPAVSIFMLSSPGPPATVRSALVSDAARIAELGAHVFSAISIRGNEDIFEVICQIFLNCCR